MFAPLRSLNRLRPSASPAVLGTVAVDSVIFAATPFLLGPVAERHGVSVGASGLVSVAQLGAFAAASVVVPRLVGASRQLLDRALVVLALANVASAFAPSFGLLVGLRLIAGVAMGVLTWIAWADAARDERSFGDVAAAGPVAAAIAAPVLGVAAAWGGMGTVYLALAAVAAAGWALPGDVAATSPPVRGGQRSGLGGGLAHRTADRSSSRSAVVVLAALAVFTLASSSLFLYTGVIASDAGLTPLVVSIGFSLSSLAGVPATRLRLGGAGWWIASIALAATAVSVGASAPLFLAGMTWWGVAYWIGVPAAMRHLVARSEDPATTVGATQGAMAAGRAIGPAAGGVLIGAGSPIVLGLVAAATIAACGVTIAAADLVSVRRAAAAEVTALAA
ncbi:MAG: hypothetical protein S0880_23650 [Actinomycetota bacterium]|nr:hypothetical protein [Actinomycetota bacterium]